MRRCDLVAFGEDKTRLLGPEVVTLLPDAHTLTPTGAGAEQAFLTLEITLWKGWGEMKSRWPQGVGGI